MEVTLAWRGPFTNEEVNALHAEAFATSLYDESEWNWVELTGRHSLGWVVARDGREGVEGRKLVGFVNVVWDGLVHAWLQDTMVAASARGRGVGTALVDRARDAAKAAGCGYCMWTSPRSWARSTSGRAASGRPARPDRALIAF